VSASDPRGDLPTEPSNGNGNGHSNGNGRVTIERSDSQQEPPPLRFHWQNMLSLRYWGGALVSGIAAAVVAAILNSWLDLGQWFVTGAFWVMIAVALFSGLVARRYWCPFCRKMVKSGATVCPHCGREFEV